MQQATISLPLGKATLTVPAEEAARILIDTFVQARVPAVAPQQPPRIGEYWPGQGGVYAGLMRGEDGQPDWHLIVPTDPAAYIKEIAWGGYEQDEPDATHDRDGLANSRALVESDVDHPAAEWVAALTIDGQSDLYLPARDELRLCRTNVPELFANGWHWSSTQYSPYAAWGQSFCDGHQYDGHKVTQYRARAVRRVSST